jgi:hypothetical protein
MYLLLKMMKKSYLKLSFVFGSVAVDGDVRFIIVKLEGHQTVTKQNLHSSILYSVWLTTVPKPLPKRFLHTDWYRVSYFKWEYPLLSLMSSNSFLRLLPRLLVTSISPFIFPSITCFRRQFLLKMWPTQLPFRFRISCRIFLCSLVEPYTWRYSSLRHTAKRVSTWKQ